MSLPTADNIAKSKDCYRSHNLTETQFVDLGRCQHSNITRRLAYCKLDGLKAPGIIYIPGYFSRMTTAQANILEDFCQRSGRPFLKYDPEGVGESRSDAPAEASFARWYENACVALERLTSGPQMLVCASSGAWLATLLAARRPDRVHSVLMLAPGINRGLDDHLPAGAVQPLCEGDTAAAAAAGSGEERLRLQPAGADGDILVSERFQSEMRQHRVALDQPLRVSCPVRIVHSQLDRSVEWQRCLRLMEAVAHDDVRLYLLKRGDHRLAAEEHLHLQMMVVHELLSGYPVPDSVTPPPPREMAALPQNLMSNLLGQMGKRRSIASKKAARTQSKL